MTPNINQLVNYTKKPCAALYVNNLADTYIHATQYISDENKNM